MSLSVMIKRPLALGPILLAGMALLLVGAYLQLGGAARASDEGATAHVFQLLMLAQGALMLVFAVRYLRQAPASCLQVLSLQILAAMLAVLPVWYLNL